MSYSPLGTRSTPFAAAATARMKRGESSVSPARRGKSARFASQSPAVPLIGMSAAHAHDSAAMAHETSTFIVS